MSGAQGQVRIERLSIHLGEGAQRFETVKDVTLDIAPGEFVCLLGPSGCGKSTLLGALAGHLTPTGGSLAVDGVPVAGPHPSRGLVFQQHTLLPWRRVIDNVAFGPKMKGVPRAARRVEARALIEEVGLAGFEDRYPGQLSGGMQQRVEIARVLINRPRLLLMDEPFGALDALTRTRMQALLLRVWERIRTTVVFVTHDIEEALLLADRIVVMSARPGRVVEQLAVPFARPRELSLVTEPRFVALKRHCLQLLHPDHEPPALDRLTPLGGPRPQIGAGWQFAT